MTKHVANPVLRRLLRSRAHVLLSRHVALLEITGRRTGRRFTIPVEYRRDGDSLTVRSRPGHRWWRNLRGGAPLTVVLRGTRRRGCGHVVREDGPIQIAIDLAPTAGRPA